MMKVHVVAVGKLREGYFREAAAEYEKRLSRFCKLEIIELPESTLKEEGEAISKLLKGKVFVLAVEGEALTSEAFAEKIGKLKDAGEELTFVIGSSEGLDAAVKKRADLLLSFSRMTFPHRLFRVMLLEQLYRAFMICAGAVYHK